MNGCFSSRLGTGASLVTALFISVVLVSPPTVAQTPPDKVTPEQIRAGEKDYSLHCAPCHGTRMLEPPNNVDLRKFPRDQRSRFINTVNNGRNSMPPWRGALSPEEIDALWAYVSAGEPN